jgi:hypothetical protein
MIEQRWATGKAIRPVRSARDVRGPGPSGRSRPGRADPEGGAGDRARRTGRTDRRANGRLMDGQAGLPSVAAFPGYHRSEIPSTNQRPPSSRPDGFLADRRATSACLHDGIVGRPPRRREAPLSPPISCLRNRQTVPHHLVSGMTLNLPEAGRWGQRAKSRTTTVDLGGHSCQSGPLVTNYPPGTAPQASVKLCGWMRKI